MAQLSKEQVLDTLEERVEGQLRKAISHYQNMSEEVLGRAAAGGGWSIAQCLEHLNSYSRYYMPLLQQQLESAPCDSSSGGRYPNTWLGRYFTRMMEPGKGGKKYKAAGMHMPAEDLDAHAVVAEFIQHQEVMLHCLRLARQKCLSLGRIRVSVARWLPLKPGDVLQFMIAHHERHVQQADRIAYGKK